MNSMSPVSKPLQRRFWSAVVVPVAVLATVSACGGEDGTQDTHAGSRDETTSAAATRSDAPVDVDGDLVDADGTVLGTASLVTGEPGWGVGAHAEVTVHGLAPGLHAISLHEVGRCDPGPDGRFPSAGDRLTEGVGGSQPPGALPSLLVTEDEFGSLDTVVGTVDLPALVDGDGTALLIYAEPGPDPAAAGAPVACAALTG